MRAQDHNTIDTSYKFAINYPTIYTKFFLDKNVYDFLVHKMEMVERTLELVVDKCVVVIVMRSDFAKNLSTLPVTFFPARMESWCMYDVRLGK